MLHRAAWYIGDKFSDQIFASLFIYYYNSNGKIISEWRIGKDVEGVHHLLEHKALSPHF
jgi:hypothetical protein